MVADAVLVSALEAMSVITQQGCAWRKYGGSLGGAVCKCSAGHDGDAHSVVLLFEWPIARPGRAAKVVHTPATA